MKQVFWFLCAIIAPALIGGSLVSVAAQTSSPTPDPFTVQLTNTSAPFNSQMGDISANGRFVVFTSNGDLSTEKMRDNRNNADGNREIFLLDYAQRRIFQITNTRNVPKETPSPSPTPTPSPSPSPTPTPSPTPADLTQVQIEVDNRSPMISLTGMLSEGQRVYTIVFSSNALHPGNFAGSPSSTDANSEIWIYKLPAVTDVDLTLGAEIPFVDLATGSFKQVTDTTATRAPTPGSTSAAPFFADDNRDPAISDDGNIIAFISTRTHPGTNNSDNNPELFLYNVTDGSFTQATNTHDATNGIGLVFQSSPSLSSDGSVVAFLSSANLPAGPDDNNVTSSNADGNAEIYLASFSGSTARVVKQVTRTLNNAGNVNVLSTGRRLSRNGALIAFESTATDPKSNAAPAGRILGLWVYNVGTDTFNEIGTRPPLSDIGRFPMFTDYNSSLAPSSLVFTSFLNFRPDGSFPSSQAQASEGLNVDNSPEIFLTQIPASSSNTFTRLTNMPVFNAAGTRPIASETRKRIAFAVAGEELGGGNADGSQEIFYLLTPQFTATSGAALSFFTGASNMPVTAASLPSPTPTPTPFPSPVPGQPIGLAPGELSIVRSTVALAPSDVMLTGDPETVASETKRSPALPVELNGVSVSVRGAAAGLYYVSSTNKQINFVMPVGLPVGIHTVVVANTDTAHRGLVQVVIAQPDIFSTTGDAGGRALTRAPEPFSVGQTIELTVTGVRLATAADITVTVGTTAISGAQIVRVSPNTNASGFDFIQFTLPDSLAGAGDVPIQVTFSRANAITTVSRPADTAPHITIN